MRREICLVALSGALLLTAPAPARSPSAGVANLAQSTAVQPPASVSVPSHFPPPIVVESGVARGSGKMVARAASAGTSVSSVVLAAYRRAAEAVPDSCHLEVSLLAAIGQVESGNLAGRDIDTKHRATPAVLGPLLDGNPYSAIRDTDDGLYDDDSTWDRAVGPMQFIPSTWIRFGVDLDGDGVRDPQDMEDAAGSAAAYLCFGGRDLATESGLRAAILSYNHSVDYLALVLSWKEQFDVNGFGDIGDPVIVPTSTTPDQPDPAPKDDQPDGTTTSADGPLPTLPPTHPPKDPPTQPPTLPPTHPPTPSPTPELRRRRRARLPARRRRRARLRLRRRARLRLRRRARLRLRPEPDSVHRLRLRRRARLRLRRRARLRLRRRPDSVSDAEPDSVTDAELRHRPAVTAPSPSPTPSPSPIRSTRRPASRPRRWPRRPACCRARTPLPGEELTSIPFDPCAPIPPAGGTSPSPILTAILSAGG